MSIHNWNSAMSSWGVSAPSYEDIVKGKYKPKEPNTGFQSIFADPLSIQNAMGFKDKRNSLTYDVLKRVPQQLALISAIIQTRCNQVAAFSVPYRLSKSLGYEIKHKNPARLTTKGEREMIQSLEQFIYNCGVQGSNPYNEHIIKRDDFEAFLRKIVRDSLTFDQACVEVVPNLRGEPYEFMAVDASTIRIAAFDNPSSFIHTTGEGGPLIAHSHTPHSYRSPFNGNPYRLVSIKEQSKRPSYVQVFNGQIVNYYTKDEMAFGIRNPRTDLMINGYGLSEIELLISIITAHLYAEDYNLKFFQQGCVSGDTQVYTEDGIRNIEELVGESFKVWNGTEFVDADAVVSGYKPAIRTVLSSSASIITSPDHKFLTANEYGSLCMRPISGLVVGDYVAQADECINFTSKDPLVVKVGVAHQVAPKETGVADADFYEFVGWLVGDGCANATEINRHLSLIERKALGKRKRTMYNVCAVFGPKDTEMKEKVTNTLNRYGVAHRFGLAGGEWGGTPLDTLFIKNKAFYDFLIDEVGVSRGKSHNKTVPFRLFSETVENRAAFLRGLFSADGSSVANGKSSIVKLATSSKELFDGVQHLLWSLGISSTLDFTLMNTSGRPCYYLRVNDLDKFFDLIGFSLSYKNNFTSTNRKCVGGSVPLSVQQGILTKLINTNVMSMSQLRRAKAVINGNKKAGFSRPTLKRLCEAAGVSAPELSYRWVKIKDITDLGLQIPMYDIRQTHELHQWSAGPCIVSNSNPKGILSLKGDSMSPEMLEDFRRMWRASMEGTANFHRTPIFQSEQGVDWLDLHKTNSDMEYNAWLEYLIKITSAVFLVDPAELNFDLAGGVSQTPLFESSQEWKLKASRDKGLKPLLRFISKLVNEYIIARIDDDFMFDFVGLDELTEQEKHELRVEQLNSYMTLNEIRRAQDLPDIEQGDIPLNPTYVQARATLMQEEQQKQQMEAQQGSPQAGQAPEEESEEGQEEDLSPAYADRFTKAIDMKVLEIELDDESWIDYSRE